MRSFKILMVAVLALGTVAAAQAELQNVEVGGSVRIRGNWFDFDDNAFINAGEEFANVEQRTRLNVKADFTDEVSVFIEFDSYENWGDNFRSNYVTGVDGFGGDDVELYQSYIEINNAWGLPIRTRIGRQELEFGSEWLLGNQDTASVFTGLSFDGIRTSYTADSFTVDVLSMKLSETFNNFADGDTNLYAIYGSYIGLEDWQFDAYWMYVMEDEGDNGAATVAEGVLGAAAGDVDLHTIGLRGAGTYGAFDLESEIAYQFGEIDVDNGGFFGDDDLEYDALAFNLEAGYTFDITWTPRVYLGAAFFEGGDQDNGGFFFGDDDNDLSFNRLFSNWEYSEFLENTDLSNSLIYRAGISAMPTEKISLLLALAYFQADEEVDLGFDGFGIFDLFDNDADDNEGLEVGLYGDYQYSEDLVFRAGFAHFFGDDGLEDGNFVILNGLGAFADTEDDGDYNYLFWEAEISF
ncbi:MAG: alginate export family protein [Candidatus Hydrogenedentes bacterium]|nr:alginate export family protein [Candidatus Hydrogenedentota bacterium]